MQTSLPKWKRVEIEKVSFLMRREQESERFGKTERKLKIKDLCVVF